MLHVFGVIPNPQLQMGDRTERIYCLPQGPKVGIW
jgi:hypothetical protein